jgi:hypothetical protein
VTTLTAPAVGVGVAAGGTVEIGGHGHSSWAMNQKVTVTHIRSKVSVRSTCVALPHIKRSREGSNCQSRKRSA